MAKKNIEVDERVVLVQEQMQEHLERIQSLEEEEATIEAVYKARVEKLKADYEARQTAIRGTIDLEMTQLKTLFEQIPHKATKTQEKVSLLSGDVVLKKAAYKLDYDKTVLLELAEKEDSPLALYIKTKTTNDFDWAAFKDTLMITENGEIIDKLTGEVLNMDGLSVKEEDAAFMINNNN